MAFQIEPSAFENFLMMPCSGGGQVRICDGNRRKDRWSDNQRHVVLERRQTLCRELREGGGAEAFRNDGCLAFLVIVRGRREMRGGEDSMHCFEEKVLCWILYWKGRWMWWFTLEIHLGGNIFYSIHSIQCPSGSMCIRRIWLSEKETIDRGMFALNAGFTSNSNVVSVRIRYA